MDDKPRLPPEIIEQIVFELQYAHQRGDPSANRALSSLLLVSRLVRHWALQAKYAVFVAPRHVREFRKWVKKESHDMIGYNKALFVALDDVSKLTSTSAGWESDLQRLLERMGPTVTHLSLWTSETRAVLRDPAQIRGPRLRTRVPIDTLDDVVASTIKRRRKLERHLRRMRSGVNDATTLRPLKMDKDRDDRLTKAEIAAAKERARQKIPKWLRNELRTKEEAEVKKTYKAHIGTEVREYQHELDVQDIDNGKGSTIAMTSSKENNSIEEESSCDSDDDHEVEWGCMPIKLSICPSLPLHKHEDALLFASMTIWTRVEELDVFVTVPDEASRYLELFSGLVAIPLRSFRMSSIYASLLIVSLSPTINIARGIGALLKSTTLSSSLHYEFKHMHIREVSILERAVEIAIAEASCEDKPSQSLDERIKSKGGLTTTMANLDTLVKVTVTQGSQPHWGKLKDRRESFLNSTMHL